MKQEQLLPWWQIGLILIGYLVAWFVFSEVLIRILGGG